MFLRVVLAVAVFTCVEAQRVPVTMTIPPPVVRTESLIRDGGLTEARPGDAAAQKIANQVKNKLQTVLKRTFTDYTVTSYKTQVVAGTYWYLKVHIKDTAGGEYVVHLQVFQALGGAVSLSGGMFPKNWNEPISYSGFTALN